MKGTSVSRDGRVAPCTLWPHRLERTCGNPLKAIYYMKVSKIAKYREVIAAFSSEERQLLRLRAQDPFTESNTGPFFRTGKAGDKYVYIAYRPNRVTKTNLGSPMQVLSILDQLESIVVVSPPPPVGPSEPPTNFPPPQPPPLPPKPDTSWRVPVYLALFSAIAALFISYGQISDVGAVNKAATVADRVANQEIDQLHLPQTSSVEDRAATVAAIVEPLLISNPSSLSSSTPARVAALVQETQQTSSYPAAKASNQPARPCGKLAAVFAALTARCNQTSTDSATVALFTQNLASVIPVLQTTPSHCPILPRASVGSAGLRWPDRALVDNVVHNLRAVSFEGGVLVLWIKDANLLRQSFATNGSVISGLQGWQNGPWDYTIWGGRIEIREVAVQ